MLLTLATALGRTGCSYVLGPAFSERRALASARSTDRHQNHAPFSRGRCFLNSWIRLSAYRDFKHAIDLRFRVIEVRTESKILNTLSILALRAEDALLSHSLKNLGQVPIRMRKCDDTGTGRWL